ncbi:hypothetical protein GCM10022631_15610 [Deinococcus rubellus]|uniref:hypothetical protein n=1 Tax=Deinococcus rubellus TaxID=1889240 RepID=UPI0031E67C3B
MKGTTLGVGNDSPYTSSITFGTFSLPVPYSGAVSRHRRDCTFPGTALKHRHRQPTPGKKFKDNLLAEYHESGKKLVGTITTLADAHNTLDAAVVAAYG